MFLLALLLYNETNVVVGSTASYSSSLCCWLPCFAIAAQVADCSCFTTAAEVAAGSCFTTEDHVAVSSLAL
jgi:hypothetical protein